MAARLSNTDTAKQHDDMKKNVMGEVSRVFKPEFIGRAAALKDRDTPPKKKLVPLIVDTDVEVVGYESVMKGSEAVGQVTSGGFAHWADKSMAMAYVRADLARDGEKLSITIFGQDKTATVATTPLFDANGGRQRG